MELTDAVYEGSRKQENGDTAVIEGPVCMFKEMALNPASTTFYGPRGVKSRPENEFNRCFSCNGYNLACEEYKQFLEARSSEFQ